MDNEINNKLNIEKTIDKSEDYFETKITYISAGTLGLSFAFIEKIVNITNSTNKWLLILGWLLLCATLLINLMSHLISKRYAYKIEDELDELDSENEEDVNKFNKNVRKRNYITDIINFFSGIILILGIISIVIFASLNITKQTTSDKQPKNNINEILIDSANVSIKLNEINIQINDTIFKIERYGKNNKKNTE
ncbi:MAG: hypothetical protein ACOYOV_14035 [Bacteroidales bacterium]